MPCHVGVEMAPPKPVPLGQAVISSFFSKKAQPGRRKNRKGGGGRPKTVAESGPENDSWKRPHRRSVTHKR